MIRIKQKKQIELADVFEGFILGQVMVTVPPHGSAPHQV